MKHQGGISGFRGFAVEPSGLAPPGINPGRKDFTIAEVLAWARTKPADERYVFVSPQNCALAQFGRATGRMYLVGCGEASRFVGCGEALTALALSSTFGELVSALERVVEPSVLKRAWARLTGKTIGNHAVLLYDKWARIDAYMAAEQVSA